MTDEMILNVLNDQAFDEKEVAKFLSISTGQLKKQRREGTGPPFLKINYSVRYLRSDLEKYIKQCRREQTNGR